MGVTIHVNGKSNSLAHKGSMGIAKSTIPDVCKTPSPGGPVPIPYPVIISMSNSLAKGTKTVKVDGRKMAAVKGSELSRCNGDEPGTAGGVKSSTNMKEATWLLYSFDVKLDGKNACRLSDKMMMNHGNTVCLAGFIQKMVGLSDAEFKEACKKCAGKVADQELWSSKKMQSEYKKTLKDPSVKTGADVQAALRRSLAAQGYSTVTQGTTDSSGNIKVKKQKGPCAVIKEKATEIHEKVHQDHVRDLEKIHGKGTPAYDQAFNDAKDWVQDEVNAHGADQKFWNDFKAECKGL